MCIFCKTTGPLSTSSDIFLLFDVTVTMVFGWPSLRALRLNPLPPFFPARTNIILLNVRLKGWHLHSTVFVAKRLKSMGTFTGVNLVGVHTQNYYWRRGDSLYKYHPLTHTQTHTIKKHHVKINYQLTQMTWDSYIIVNKIFKMLVKSWNNWNTEIYMCIIMWIWISMRVYACVWGWVLWVCWSCVCTREKSRHLIAITPPPPPSLSGTYIRHLVHLQVQSYNWIYNTWAGHALYERRIVADMNKNHMLRIQSKIVILYMWYNMKSSSSIQCTALRAFNLFVIDISLHNKMGLPVIKK